MKPLTKKFIYFVLFIFLQIQFAYSECIEGDCLNGFGKMEWDDGGYAEANFKDGYLDGFGKYTWPSGDAYEGDWLKGQRHGYGTYYWTNNGANFETKAFYFNHEPIGEEITKGGTFEYYTWYSKPNVRSGDHVVINKYKNQNPKRIQYFDQYEKKLAYDKDGNYVGENVIINNWSNFISFDEQGNISRNFPIYSWSSKAEVKEYNLYDFYVNQIDYFNINREQKLKEADLFYFSLAQYILMMIEGKKEVNKFSLSKNERSFDRKLTQEEYACFENFMQTYNMQCEFYELKNLFKPILSNNLPFSFPTDVQLHKDINNSVFLRSYSEDWIFKNVDTNKDQFVDVNEIHAIISNPDKDFWYHIWGNPVIPGFEYFLLYDHIHSSSYKKEYTEKQWELELLEAIPYNKDFILLYENESTWNEDFKKFDWNNDDKVTKDEFLKYYNLRFIDNLSGPLLPYSLIDENYDDQRLEDTLIEMDKEIKNQKLEVKKDLNKPKLDLCEMENTMMQGSDITLWLYQFNGCGYKEKCTNANAMLLDQSSMCNSGNNASCQVINSNLPKLKYNCQSWIDSPLLN